MPWIGFAILALGLVTILVNNATGRYYDYGDTHPLIQPWAKKTADYGSFVLAGISIGGFWASPETIALLNPVVFTGGAILLAYTVFIVIRWNVLINQTRKRMAVKTSSSSSTKIE